MRKKTGGRKKGTPNKVTSKVKERLSLVINKTVKSIDISDMSSSDKIKLIQIGLQYLLPKLQHTIESNNRDLPAYRCGRRDRARSPRNGGPRLRNACGCCPSNYHPATATRRAPKAPLRGIPSCCRSAARELIAPLTFWSTCPTRTDRALRIRAKVGLPCCGRWRPTGTPA